jgi:hypothetical protein
MMRLTLQGIAIMLGAASALLAWAWPEARSAFVVLGSAMVIGLLWLARRFPQPGRAQLAVAGAAVFIGIVTLAVLLPSTRVLCDCPLPADTVRGCPCRVDYHWPLRAAMTGAGVAIAGLLLLRSRHQRSLMSPAPGSGP